MADLDTPSKRGSSVGILLFSILGSPFPPDGSLDQGDRQDIAISYSGIAASAPAAPDIEGGHLAVRGLVHRYVNITGRVYRYADITGRVSSTIDINGRM